MSSATLPAVRDNRAGQDQTPSLVSGVGAVTSAIEQIKSLRTFINAEMIEGVDYGTIPGTGAKKTLLLPGAQKTALYFNTAARFENDRAELGCGHLEVLSRCHLVGRANDRVMAEGFGSCSTMESKYRWRKGERTCPRCGVAAIIKGKEEYGGGWLCYGKKGGCGAKFQERDESITSQAVGRAENPDIYDVRNTVLKIAMKRAQVAAALALGAMAELFTQDLEDFYDLAAAAPEETAPPRDPGRDEINAAFPVAGRPTHREPEGRPAREASPRRAAPRAPASEGWAKWSSRTLREALDAWRNEQAVDLEVPEAGRSDLPVNVHQVTNHVVTAACKAEHDGRPLVNEAKILAPNGKRDFGRVKQCAEWLFANHRDWTVHEVASYLEGKRDRARQAAVDPDDFDLPEPGSDG